MSENRFNIDFFEFSFLVEACIPPVPIARYAFFKDVINKHYHVLTDNERVRLFEWMNRCPRLTNGVEEGEELCQFFNARFNPDNQYQLTVDYNGETTTVDCFKHNDEYYTNTTTSINETFIKSINKIKK